MMIIFYDEIYFTKNLLHFNQFFFLPVAPTPPAVGEGVLTL